MLSRILLVEDDQTLGAQVRESLTSAGFQVAWVTNGGDAKAEELEGLSLIVLDLMLPGGHGLDVLRHVRNSQHHVPVLILSARTETADKVRALELGADDYLTKPFWPEELLARVKARLRRPALSLDLSVLEVGQLRLNVDGRAVAVSHVPVELTRVEFDLLHALAKRPGTALSRAWLVDHVLGPDRDGVERTLDVHVSRLRKKLGTAGSMVATVWGVGYRLLEHPDTP